MQRKKGFTMIEIVVVLIVLAVLAAVTIPSMTGFIDEGKQNARDVNARTLFMAAQTALANELGRNQAINVSTEHVSLGGIANISDVERENNAENIYALSIAKGDGSTLKNLIDPYVNDKSLLGDTILIEYNIKTGNVLSCFYSEEQPSFSYDGGGYNVIERSKGALAAAHVGFYGVDYTGLAPQNAELPEFTVILRDYTDPAGSPDGVNGGKNYGLLTLELTLPGERDPIVNYEIKLLSSAAGGAEAVVRLSGGDAPAGAGTQYDFKLEDALEKGNLSLAMANTGLKYTDALGEAHPVCAFGDGGNKLVIVLDGISEGLSIAKNYPTLGCGELRAEVTASDGTQTRVRKSYEDALDDGEAPNVYHTHTYHTYFDGSGTGGDETPYGIASVRHLNNLRYNTIPAAYAMKNDVRIKRFDEVLVNWKPLCSAADKAAGGSGAFMGTLDGRRFSVVDACAYSVARAGLFDTIGADGRVEYLMLAYDQVNADDGTMGRSTDADGLSGGIAAENRGTVSACTVTGKIFGGDTAGGVAGINSGHIEFCMVGAHVTAKITAGGAAGKSSGEIAFTEVGTASDEAAGGKPDHISGSPYFGVLYKNTNPVYKDNAYGVTNNTFTICATGTTGNGATVGGVVGRITSLNASVKGCVNASLVHGYGGIAGGIVGAVDAPEAIPTELPTLIEYCYNAGNVHGGPNRLGGGVAGGVVGELCGGMKGCYNTGLVNIVTSDRLKLQVRREGTGVFDTVALEWLTGLYVRRNWADETDIGDNDTVGTEYYENHFNYIGGLVGHGFAGAEVTDSYNAQMAGDKYGGVFGVMEAPSANVQRVYFLKNLQNTEREYHYANGDDALRRTGVTQLSSLSLDGVTKMTGLSPNLGGGVYNYPFPYYDDAAASESELGEEFHRTAYTKPTEELGRISVKNVTRNGAASIEMTFCVLPDSADIAFVAFYGETEIKTYLRLSKEDLEDLRDGAERNPATVQGGMYRLEGYAVPASAEERKLGYDYEYHLFLRWETQWSILGSYNGLSRLTYGTADMFRAELHESEATLQYDGLRYAKSDNLSRSNHVWLHETDNGTELAIDGIWPANSGAGNATVEGIYILCPESDTRYEIEPVNSSDSYEDCRESNFNALTPNGGAHPLKADGLAGTYYLYRHGTENALVLMSDKIAWCRSPNGLDAIAEPFRICVKTSDGTYYTPIYDDWTF